MKTADQLKEQAIRSIGRPTKYQPEYCKEAIEWLASPGKSKRSLAALFSVSPETIYDWMRENAHFSDAVKKGLEIGRYLFLYKCFLDSDEKNVNTSMRQLAGRNIYGLDTKEADKKQFVGELPNDPQAALSDIANLVSNGEISLTFGKGLAEIINMQVMKQFSELNEKVASLESVINKK